MPFENGKELCLNHESFERYLDQQNINNFLDEIAQKNVPVAKMFVGFYKYCSKRYLKDIWTKFASLLDKEDIKTFDIILAALISDDRKYSEALRFMFEKIAIFKVTNGQLDYIAQKITSKDNDRMAAFIPELNQLMDLNYRFNPIMVNTMMQHGMDKYEVLFHELVSKSVFKHSDIAAIDVEFLKKFCNYRSMLLGRSLIKRK